MKRPDPNPWLNGEKIDQVQIEDYVTTSMRIYTKGEALNKPIVGAGLNENIAMCTSLLYKVRWFSSP